MPGFNEIIKGDKPVLVDFFAEWCGPCKMMPPILDEVKHTLGDDVRILKIDIDRNPGAANAYNVRSVPTLLIFKSGKIIWRQSGVVQAGELMEILKRS